MAIRLAKSISKNINKALGSMKAAKDWGVVDLLGGKLLSTALKHSNINAAQPVIQQVSRQLQEYDKKIAHLSTIKNIDIQFRMEPIESIGDYVFDGLFFDWVIQAKIKNVIANLQTQQSYFQRIITDFQGKYRDAKTEYVCICDKIEMIYMEYSDIAN